MSRRVSQRGVRFLAVPTAPREPAGVVIVASTAVLVAASVIVAGLGAGAIWVFELLAATGLLVGLGVAFGAFDRGPVSSRRRARRGGGTRVTPQLDRAVEAQLGTLDPVEHRRLDLGSPWPTVLVGPTGVTILAVAGQVGGTSPARVREVLVEVRELVREHAGGRPMAVRALLVVPDHEVAETVVDEVRLLSVSDLADSVTRGPIVPMATVTSLFNRLTGALAPDLRADAV